MSANVFVDTNVFLYARDLSESEKQPIAREWVQHLWQTRTGRTGVQVLNEYYVNVTKRIRPGLSIPEAQREIGLLMSWQPIDVTTSLIEDAWALEDRYSVSHWDALIVAAASRANCGYLLTEDLQAGQRLGTVQVIDPFSAGPDSLNGVSPD